MIKIFNKTEAFPGKVNFVDDRGIMLGYDMEQSCCERAGWDISALDLAETEDAGITEMPYHFDSEFIEENRHEQEDGLYTAKFRLLPDDPKGLPVYLVLSNRHGYYAQHGFEMKNGETGLRCGSL